MAEAADAVIAMLPAGGDVRGSACGAERLAEGLSEGDVQSDMSSYRPWLTVELAQEPAARDIAERD